MRISLITPASTNARNGNRITTIRWARILKELGHRVAVSQQWNHTPCDMMIALHALRSYESILAFRQEHPHLPLVVALTGTDLYRDIHADPRAQRSLELATRLVVLQAMGLKELSKGLRKKSRVIYQSTESVEAAPSNRNGFQVCVIGHLRPEKDPLRTAMASRYLPKSSQLTVLQIGRPLSKDLQRRLRDELRRSPRLRWLGELPHWKTRRVLARSHLLAVTSRMEGSSNVLSEAIASQVPVVASKIPGLAGTLGGEYPGYFPVGDTRALADLLHRAETDASFYRNLKSHCARLQPLVEPKREIQSWRNLLRELG